MIQNTPKMVTQYDHLFILLTILTLVSSDCGGYFNHSHGIIQTPNFPNQFQVPIQCRWIIDASFTEGANPSIIVYLTQVYAFTGLAFYEYAHYDNEIKFGGQLMHTVTEQNFTRVRMIRSHNPFMVIEFRLDRLEGNHLRVLDNLLDVYGFNITFEIESEVRQETCTIATCSFTGNCFARHDYRSFYCQCFPGFSGPNCGTGPRCPLNNNICHNGGTCRHVGANASTCICPTGYTGDKCDVQLNDPTQFGCETGQPSNETCIFQCPYNGHLQNVCNCQLAGIKTSDKYRYTQKIRITNLSAIRNSLPVYYADLSATSKSLYNLIEKQLFKYLKSNMGKIDDLRVLGVSNEDDVVFHFYSSEKDSYRVRDVMNRLLERKRLGNFTLAQTHFSLKQEPSLLLQQLRLNREANQPVRQGDFFELNCIAQGSSDIQFNWFKDGIYINVSRAIRQMDTKIITEESDNQTIGSLYIYKATYLDNGVYTCQVVDWGIQQCRSLRIDVLLPPIVQISPMSITIQKGDNISIKCLSPNDHHHEKFGYNWTKNKNLFALIPGKEVWEDLRPSGSILKIYNAQKSAIYQCLVHGRADSRTASVRVEVTNRTSVPLCPSDLYMNVKWPETVPGVEAIQNCPEGLQGNVVRLCSLVDGYSVKWDLPNFSECKSTAFLEIEDNFRALEYGYQNTTGLETLSRCLDFLHNRNGLYPGEGHSILRLLNDVLLYINITSSSAEVPEASETFYKIVNLLLKYKHSLIQQQDIISLQKIARTQAHIWGTKLKDPSAVSPMSSTDPTALLNQHIALDALVLDVVSLESQTLQNLHIPFHQKGTWSYPSWFEDQVDIKIENGIFKVFGNNSFTINVLIYKNLPVFLPIRYVAKSNTGIDLQYEIISHIVNIEMGQSNLRISPPQGLFWIDLEFSHAQTNNSIEFRQQMEWNVTCAVTDVATFKHTWDLDSCITRVINTSLTRCTCTKTGTYAVLWTRHIVTQLTTPRKEQTFIILFGCIICLALTLLTFGVMIPYWWHHRTSLIFLKLQCCVSIAGAMSIFIYALRIPNNELQESHLFIPIATALELFLLIGMSSHLSKLLIVYTEIVVIPRVRQHLQQTVVGVITGVPVLTVLSNHIAYRSLGLEMRSWWLISGTLIFTIFVASASVMILLFIFIYVTVMRKLHQLINKHLDKTKALSKRIGLLNRAAVIFVSIVLMEVASIFYINLHKKIHQYIFCCSCILVGVTIFSCYILKNESSLQAYFKRKLKLDKHLDENYSSESVNSPLSFFTKQDGEVEIDAAPPSRLRGLTKRNSGPTSSISTSEITELMSEQRGKTLYRYKSSDMNSSTIETYVHSISDSSNEKLYPSDLQDQHLIDLERYGKSPQNTYIDLVHIPNSQRKYCEPSYPASLDSKYYYPEGYNDTVIRPVRGKCYIRDYSTPPTIVIDSQPPVEETSITDPPEEVIPNKEESVEVYGSDGLLLDRISLDLDYLLNRTDIEPNKAPVRKSSLKSPGILRNSHIGQIQEEDEDIVDESELKKAEVNDEEGKTVC